MYKEKTDFIPQNLRFTPRTVLKKPPDESLGVFLLLVPLRLRRGCYRVCLQGYFQISRFPPQQKTAAF